MTEKLNNEVDSLKKNNVELENQIKRQSQTIQNLKRESAQQTEAARSLEGELQVIVGEKEKEFKKQIASLQNELENAKKEAESSSSLQNQLAEMQQTLAEYEKQLSEKVAKMAELEGANQELSSKITELEGSLAEISGTKNKFEEIQKALDAKNSEVEQLNGKIQELEKQQEQSAADHKAKLESLNEQQAQELEAQKSTYDMQIKALENKYGMTKEAILRAEKEMIERVIFLRYTGANFVMVRSKPDEGISMILDQQEGKWLMVWDANAGFVERRTAERLARSIAKAGWPLPSGARVGLGFDLEMQGAQSVPGRLLRDQHEYMD